MKIVIAPDSFKESLSAMEAARAIEHGFKKVFAEAKYDLVPMADGGEGTVDAMVRATNGTFLTVRVSGPLNQRVDAVMGILGDGKTAVIEMAAASGLPLVRNELRNPMNTTTLGTGELIRAGLDRGIRRFVIGIGGSATVDGGIGAMVGLGAKFFDDHGSEVSPNGRGVGKISKIDFSGFDKRVAESEILVACDVNNPLTGPTGAARVFGPQKGATPEMVKVLDENLKKYASVVRQQMGVEIETIPGAGAAGGLGAAMVGFCKAKLCSGSELVAKTIGLSERLQGADLCITGEGRIDGQSAGGKVCYRVAEIAKNQNVPAIAIVGSIGADAGKNIPPLTAYFAIVNRPMELSEAITQAEELMAGQAEQVARIIKTSHECHR
jgi:glycerate kinase